jgi:hypothetical protein
MNFVDTTTRKFTTPSLLCSITASKGFLWYNATTTHSSLKRNDDSYAILETNDYTYQLEREVQEIHT